MEKKLHLLDSFNARGSDGATYRVHGYEHLVRDDTQVDRIDQWESTGEAEYRLADGRRVDAAADGSLRLIGAGVQLRREAFN